MKILVALLMLFSGTALGQGIFWFRTCSIQPPGVMGYSSIIFQDPPQLRVLPKVGRFRLAITGLPPGAHGFLVIQQNLGYLSPIMANVNGQTVGPINLIVDPYLVNEWVIFPIAQSNDGSYEYSFYLLPDHLINTEWVAQAFFLNVPQGAFITNGIVFGFWPVFGGTQPPCFWP